MTFRVFVPIDVQNGFTRTDLDWEKGGSLYVPGGEQIDSSVADLARGTLDSGGFVVISQDYHPADHVSFMTNHPGVMEYRAKRFEEFLQGNHRASSDLQRECINPVHFFDGFENPPKEFPFQNILLDRDGRALGLVTGDQILDVETDKNGRITKVLEDRSRGFDGPNVTNGELVQTLWKEHCVQGTESTKLTEQFGQAISAINPLGLSGGAIVVDDLVSGKTLPVVADAKTFLVTKGTSKKIDSYGVGIENDGKTETRFADVLKEIGRQAQTSGEREIDFNIGGLATNFCVEFSLKNIAELAPEILQKYGIGKINIRFLPEISRGIPIPNLESAPDRMKRAVEDAQTRNPSIAITYSQPSVQEVENELELARKPNDAPERIAAKQLVKDLREMVKKSGGFVGMQ